MGTRGFMGLVIDGTLKIGYVHWDSHPTGLGYNMLEALRGMLHDDATIVRTETLARRLTVVQSDTKPTAEQIEALKRYAATNVATGALDEWYVLLRRTQGNLIDTLQAGYIEDASDFPSNSLFCEYGYLIDFDTKVFEAYEGFQTEPHKQGRFASEDGPDWIRELGHHYYPCARVGMWSFNKLPKNEDFLKTFQGYEEDE